MKSPLKAFIFRAVKQRFALSLALASQFQHQSLSCENSEMGYCISKCGTSGLRHYCIELRDRSHLCYKSIINCDLDITNILVVSLQVRYIEVFDITNPRFNEQLWQVPSDFVKSRFHCSNINMMIQPLYFLPVCLQFLWIQLPLSFTTQFIYESFISYHLTWHIPLNKTLHVPSFSLECSVRHLQNINNKTENHKGFFVNRNRTTLSRFLSYKVSRLRSVLKFQNFAVLLASPNNCHGVSCVGTLLCSLRKQPPFFAPSPSGVLRERRSRETPLGQGAKKDGCFRRLLVV